MGLSWARLDVNIAMHDKMLDLLADPSPKRWQAAASYMFALGWSVGAGTDGRVRAGNLLAVHGTQATARLLVKYGMWDEAPGGYQIRNFELRQQLSVTADAKRQAQQQGAVKGNCIRHHGQACGCWRNSVGSVA